MSKKQLKVGKCEIRYGLNQVVRQVVNRLARNTENFSQGGSVILYLPEIQAVRKQKALFKILLQEAIFKKKPKLRKEKFTLAEFPMIIFIPGWSEV